MRLFLVLFVLLLVPTALAQGGFGEGYFSSGNFDFGTVPEAEPQPSGGGGGGGSSGGGGGRLYDGQRDRFESGSRNINMSFGDIIQFYIDDKKYSLVLMKLDGVELRLKPNHLDYKIENTLMIDVNEDKKDDLSVRLNGIINSKYTKKPISAILTFTILEEKPVMEVVVEETPEVIEAEPVEELPTVTDEYIPTPDEEPKASPVAWIIIFGGILGIVIILIYHRMKGNLRKQKPKDKEHSS